MKSIEDRRLQIDHKLQQLVSSLEAENQFIGSKRIKDAIYFVEGNMSVLILGMCNLILGIDDSETTLGYERWEELMDKYRLLQDRRRIEFEDDMNIADWYGESALELPMRASIVDTRDLSSHRVNYDRVIPELA